MSTRRAPRTNREHPGRTVGGALIVFALIAAAVVVAIRAPAHGLPGQRFRTLSVQMPEVGNVRPRNEVRIGGRRVGQVLRVRLVDGHPTMDLQLQRSVGPLAADSRAVVRAKGLLGARYVELNPGRSARKVADGATLVMHGPASITVDVPTALSTLDRRTRTGLRTLLDEFGTGVAGRSAGLRSMLQLAPTLAAQNARIADAIVARTGAAARLAPSLDAGATTLDGARADIARGLRPAADTFGALADARAGVEGTLRAAPAALASTADGLDASRRVLAGLRRLAVAAGGTLPPAPAALRRTTALLRTTRRPLARADTLLAAAGDTVPAALELTDALQPVLDPVDRALTSLSPLVTVVGGYGCDLRGFASNWRSMLGYGRPNNDGKPQDRFRSQLNTLRLEAIASPDDLVATTGPSNVATKARANAYPATCTDPTSHITR
jgi:ABC-type transporter Mla subunit MlaD